MIAQGGKPSRRGVALLLVLAALILIITVVAGTARVASVRQLQSRSNASAQLADGLRSPAEVAILHWLENHASAIVLPEDAMAPAVTVLNDWWSVDGRRFTLRITAWDQCGMAPMEHLRPGSVLRTAVPHGVLAGIDAFDQREHSHLGLDQLQTGLAEVRVFPVAPPTDPCVFGFIDEETRSPGTAPARDTRPAVGAIVATHNRPPHRINVNTAPRPLLEAALLATGRGGLEAILNHRRERTPAPAPSSQHRSDQPVPSVISTSIRFASSSDAWSFRVDATVDEIRRSWWIVYERMERSRQGGPPWSITQRLVIPEP